MKRSEQQKEKKGGQDCQDSRPVYFRESHVQLRTMLLIPRSLAAAAARRNSAAKRRVLYIVVLALLCFGGCSSPSFPVRYVRIPFAAPLAKLGTRVRRGVSFEAAPRTTSATAASASSSAAAALASASLPSKEESWAFPYDLLAHIGR